MTDLWYTAYGVYVQLKGNPMNYMQLVETYLRTYIFTPQTAEAVKRAAVSAVGLFLIAFGGALVAHISLVVALGMGLIAAAGAFGIRGGAEGIYDSHRQLTGNQIPGDVRPPPPGVPE